MPDDYDDREFQRVVTEGLVPRIEGSAAFVSICPGVDRIDAKFCVELGVAIMLDKPILAVVEPGIAVSDRLRRVADVVVEADITTEEGQRTVAEAIKEFQAHVITDD